MSKHALEKTACGGRAESSRRLGARPRWPQSRRRHERAGRLDGRDCNDNPAAGVRCPAFTTRPLHAALALCATLALAPGAFAAGEENARSELDAVRKRLESVAAALARDRRARDAESESLRLAESELARTRTSIVEADTDLERISEQVNALHGQREAISARLREGQAALAARARIAYALGRRGPLELLLNQADPARASRVLGYQRFVARAGAAAARTLRSDHASLAVVEARLARAAARSVEAKTARRELSDDLEERIARRRQLLTSLDRRIDSNAARRDRLESDARRLKRVIETLRAEVEKARAEHEREQAAARAARATAAEADEADEAPGERPAVSFRSRRGRLPWPASGRAANRFGAQREGGGLTWDGFLIRTPEGTPINAIHGGQVVFADWMRGYGQLLIIDHGGGYMSLYGHAANLLKRPGDLVAAGEAVATVGASGGQAEPGVYFEIRHRGKPQNPSRWLARRGPA